MTSKPWQLSEWKRKRQELLKDKRCEYCGSTENLVIHHKEQLVPYTLHRKIVKQEFLEVKIREGEFPPPKKKTCPKCGCAIYRQIL